jgi:hypothetical protein
LFGPRATAGCYAVLTALVLLPVCLVRVPCLGDYLNHLARIHILTHIGQSALLQHFYFGHWRPTPYFGMDAPVAVLTRFTDIYTAGRIFVALCVLMPVLAAASLRYALHRRIGLVPALAFLLSYNFVLALGFLNYLFSAGLAVMLFSAWIMAAAWPRWRRAASFVPLAILLYFSHVFAFVAYGLLIAGYELGRAASRPWRVALADIAAAGLQAVTPTLLAVWLGAADTFGAVHVTRYGSLADRIGALVSPVYFPGGGAYLTGAFVLAPLLGLILARGARVPRAIWPALALVALGALAAPAMLLNIWGTALRLPLVAAIVLIGAASPPPRWGRRAGMAVLSLLAALVAARVGTASVLLHRLDGQIADMRQLVSHLPPGARVLVVDGPPDAPGRLEALGIIQHMSLVATIDRDAFLPMLFTGTTSLQLRPEFLNAASQAVGAISLAQLRDGYAHPPPPGPLPAYRDGAQQYWLGWPDKFDDVLITHFGGDVGPLPPVLHRLATSAVADLYYISRP